MFLATTALSEFWDTQEEILFLGSWCLRHDQRDRWSKLRYRVLPSPWDDRERFYRAAEYLDACSERMLELLSDYLNGVHRVKGDTRYWRILIGPWLVHHLHVLYDRVTHLQDAFRQDGSLKSLCLDPADFRVPQDAGEYFRWVLEDPYNLQLYSGLMTPMGRSFPCRRYSVQENPPNHGPLLRRMGRWGIGHLQESLGWLLKRRWEVALYETVLPRSMVLKMVWQTGFRALPLTQKTRWPAGFSKPLMNQKRTGLSGLSAQDEFERFFVQTLPQNFPSLYLEGYTAAREETLKRLPAHPAVFLSASGWHFHEPFQWTAAEASLKGRRLVALQHGGGYGVYRFTSMERHEKRVSDSYFVWGWGGSNGPHSKNVPAPQLSVLTRRSRKDSSSQEDPILFVATTNPLYFYRFFSTPQGSQMEDYFQWQFRFLQALPTPLRRRILFRPQRNPPYPHGLQERLSERFPDLRWDNGSTFHQSMRRSSLAVMDHLGTPVLESLAADRPTLLFWNPQRWEVREEAKPYFDALRDAGILWNSPEEAAAALEKVAGTLSEWWADPKIRQARENFVNRYALSQGNWAAQWRAALSKEVAEARRS